MNVKRYFSSFYSYISTFPCVHFISVFSKENLFLSLHYHHKWQLKRHTPLNHHPLPLWNHLNSRARNKVEPILCQKRNIWVSLLLWETLQRLQLCPSFLIGHFEEFRLWSIVRNISHLSVNVLCHPQIYKRIFSFEASNPAYP